MPIDIPNYELLDRVGVGGFGEVWLAKERLTGVMRAIKIVSKNDSRRANRELEGIKRYQHCSRQHSGLVQILTVGEVETAYFYAMELADAQSPSSGQSYVPKTLRSVIRERGRLDAREALEVVGQLTRAVVRLHEEGLAHNDLKPENILIIKGEPKIADLGLAALADATITSGTPAYMSSADHPSDVVALGKILYELISGCPAADYPRLPGDLVQKSSVEMTSAIRIANQACHSRTEQRFVSPLELLHALEDACRSRGGIMGRFGRLSRTGKLIACACILATMAGAVRIGLQSRREPHARLTSQCVLKGMPAPIAAAIGKKQSDASCLYVGDQKLPHGGRWKYGLNDAASNYAVDAHIVCIRPWGDFCLGVSAGDNDQPTLLAHLLGQPDGMGVRIGLESVSNEIEAENPIRGHPQPGVEYWIRLASCVDGPRLLVRPLCARDSEPLIIALPAKYDGRTIKSVFLDSEAGRDPLARFNLLDLRVSSFSSPLADVMQDAPDYGASAGQRMPVPEVPSSQEWPPGNLLTGQWHPLRAELRPGIPLWASIGSWYWFSFGEGPTDCRIECAPFALYERQTLNDPTLCEGRQMLRFDGAKLSDFRATARIRIPNPPDFGRRRPYVLPGHSGSVGLAFRLQDQASADAELGGGYFAVVTLQEGSAKALASLSVLPGLAHFGRSSVRLDDRGGGRSIAEFKDIPQQEELLGQDGFELSISAQGSRVQMRINNRPIIDCSDNQFANGRIALYASRLIALFDSLEVVPLAAAGLPTKP